MSNKAAGVVIGLLVACVLLAGYLDRPMTEVEQVYSVCMKARGEYNGFSENYCGALQEEYNIRFRCDSTEADATCWAVAND